MTWKRFYFPIKEKTIPHIFSVMGRSILSLRNSKCHFPTTVTCRFDFTGEFALPLENPLSKMSDDSHDVSDVSKSLQLCHLSISSNLSPERVMSFSSLWQYSTESEFLFLFSALLSLEPSSFPMIPRERKVTDQHFKQYKHKSMSASKNTSTE